MRPRERVLPPGEELLLPRCELAVQRGQELEQPGCQVPRRIEPDWRRIHRRVGSPVHCVLKDGAHPDKRTHHRTARTAAALSWLCPTIQTLPAVSSEIATAALCSPPNVPRSSGEPLAKRNA